MANANLKNLIKPGIVLVYYLVAVGSLQLAFNNANASPIWPPSGVAFAALWIWGYRVWPMIGLGSMLANVTVFLQHQAGPVPLVFLVSFIIGAGNVMEARIGVALLRFLIRGRYPLFKVWDIFLFVFVTLTASLSSATIGALAGTLLHPVDGILIKNIWFTWWLGDVVGILTLGPLLLAFYKVPIVDFDYRRIIEAVVLLVVLVGVDMAVFTQKTLVSQSYFPTAYLILPLIIWATYRFGYYGATLSILTTVAVTVTGTLYHAHFFDQRLNDALVLLQCFMGILTVTALVLAAALYERQQSEEDLKRNEERYRKLVENSFEMLALLDPKANITYVSRSKQTILGYTVEESVGHSMFEWIHPNDQAAIMKKFSWLLTQPGALVNAQCRLRHKDGFWRWVEATGQNLLHEKSIGAIVVNYRDITEVKLAQDLLRMNERSLQRTVEERTEQLTRTQNELKQASRLADIGTLAATVAHELRNPLGVIQIAAYNLKSEKTGLGPNKHLVNIEKKVWEGNQIIDNLLNYSRIKVPCYEKVALLNLLDECVAVTQNRFQEKNMSVEKKYDAGVDVIEADAHQIHEVFVNILNNAFQAVTKPGGKIILSTVREEDMVKVMVQDTGEGISREDLKCVFEPFFTRKSKGTGLGLTICNELVSLHQGKIEITSQPGVGTTVWVTLPIERAKE